MAANVMLVTDAIREATRDEQHSSQFMKCAMKRTDTRMTFKDSGGAPLLSMVVIVVTQDERTVLKVVLLLHA